MSTTLNQLERASGIYERRMAPVNKAWLQHRARLGTPPARRPAVRSVGGYDPRVGSGPGRVTITGEIDRTSAALALQEIGQTPPFSPLEVVLDSDGGDVSSAQEIGRAVQSHTGRTTAVIARAFSAAMWVALAADVINMCTDGEILVHPSSLHLRGGLRREDLPTADVALVAHEAELADALAAKSRSTPSHFWRYLMRGEGEVMGAPAALGYGIADVIVPWTQAELRRLGRLP